MTKSKAKTPKKPKKMTWKDWQKKSYVVTKVRRFDKQFEQLEDKVLTTFRHGRTHKIAVTIAGKSYQNLKRYSQRDYRTVTGQVRNIVLEAMRKDGGND